MTIEIITEATDLAALHTHAANRGQVLQVRLRQLCREVAGTYTVALPPMDGLPAGNVTWRFVALAGGICTAEYTIHRTA